MLATGLLTPPCMRLPESSTYFRHTPLPFFLLFLPVSLFDLGSRFFAPTHTWRKPSRAGAVKAGRYRALAARSVVSRPRLDSPCARRHADCGRDDTSEGSSLSEREELAPQPCIRWVLKTRTMMHACASAAKLRGGRPILNAGIAAMAEYGSPPPRTVIATPSRTSGWERTHNLEKQHPG
jgi:hypothetical protein